MGGFRLARQTNEPEPFAIMVDYATSWYEPGAMIGAGRRYGGSMIRVE
jgi:hypothetical protein